LAEARKRYRARLAARNLGRLMRKLCGYGTPRGLQGALARRSRLVRARVLLHGLLDRFAAHHRLLITWLRALHLTPTADLHPALTGRSSTGC
jgi:hypothetical protein